MFTIKVHPALIEDCQNLVKTQNFGNRYTANGNEEQQLTGIIGQSITINPF